MTALSRRELLQASALAGGGLLLGLRLGRAAPARAEGGAADAFRPNAWVAVESSGTVRLVCPRNEMGQGVHTSLAMLVAEELAVDPATIAVEDAPADPVYLNSLLGVQITGGSTSVRDAWEPLRRAGAAAREMLVAAAAEQWSVPAAECRAEGGHVVHGERRAAYGSLAAAAARQAVPASPQLTPAGQYRVIGRPLARLDGAAKARGRARYGIDVAQPGMLHAALAMCPVLGGRVDGYDAAAAKRRAGVRAVVDIGDAVVVVADHYWTARSALADLAVRFDEGPAAALDTAAIRAALEAAAAEPGALVQGKGDVAGALASGPVLEARYTSQLLAHATLEPPSCVARVGPEGVDVWASTQHVQAAQATAADAAGVPLERVRIHAQQIGGGFGRRLEWDYVTQAVLVAKALPGTPVKLIWSREDDLTHDFYRPPSLHLLRGAVADGRIAALSHKLVAPSVSARMFPGIVKGGLDPFMAEGTADFTYAIPHLELRSLIRDVGIRVGYWRSVSYALNAFALESFVDELAGAAGADPLAFRLGMLGHLPRQRAVLERAARDAGYASKPPAGRAFGVASMECYESHVALVAEVSGGAERVKLERLSYAVDCGVAIHPDQVVAQLESGAVSGLVNALRGKITLANGRVEQANFDRFTLPRMGELPEIRTAILEGGPKPGGMGEVGVPLVAPAIANAVFALTGKRIRSLPLEDGGVRFA